MEFDTHALPTNCAHVEEAQFNTPPASSDEVAVREGGTGTGTGTKGRMGGKEGREEGWRDGLEARFDLVPFLPR